MTNQEIIEAGQLIHDEEAVGGNTSERVGGAIKGIGQNLEAQDENIDDVNRRLANEAETRANEDTSILQALQLETTTRIEKDAQEKINRQDADAALQQAIDNEETARQNTDLSLQQAISNEAAARQTAVQTEQGLREDADAALLALINDISLRLHGYYLKTETYSKTQVDALIAAINSFEYVVAQQLPEPSAATMHKIYLIPSPHSEDKNVKDEFITINASGNYSWEQIGSTAVDLSGYSTTAQMNAAINAALTAALSGYYTKMQVEQLLTSKQDTIEDLQQIRTGAAAGATALQQEDIEEMTDAEPTPGSTDLAASNAVFKQGLYAAGLVSLQEYSGWIDSSNKVISSQNGKYRVVPVNGGETLYFERRLNRDCNLMVLADYNYQHSLPYTPHFAEDTGKFAARIDIKSEDDATITLPDTAKFLLVASKNNAYGTDVFPTDIKIITASGDISLMIDTRQAADMAATVAQAAFGTVTAFRGKKLSIIGDSISTYNKEGCKLPGYRMYYPHGNVTDVRQTWWNKVISLSKLELLVNASWSGSCVTNARSTETYEGHNFPDFYDRTALLADTSDPQNPVYPDVIIVALGTNDARPTVNAPIGTLQYDKPIAELSETYFCEAYIKGIKALQANYPQAEIYCLTFYMSDVYKAAVKAIAEHFSLHYLDCSHYNQDTMDAMHPSADGMDYIANRVADFFNIENNETQDVQLQDLRNQFTFNFSPELHEGGIDSKGEEQVRPNNDRLRTDFIPVSQAAYARTGILHDYVLLPVFYDADKHFISMLNSYELECNSSVFPQKTAFVRFVISKNGSSSYHGASSSSAPISVNDDVGLELFYNHSHSVDHDNLQGQIDSIASWKSIKENVRVEHFYVKDTGATANSQSWSAYILPPLNSFKFVVNNSLTGDYKLYKAVAFYKSRHHFSASTLISSYDFNEVESGKWTTINEIPEGTEAIVVCNRDANGAADIWSAPINVDIAKSLDNAYDSVGNPEFWLQFAPNADNHPMAYSDMTIVGQRLIGFDGSSDDLTQNGTICIDVFDNGFNQPATAYYTLKHRFGHCNTVDYNKFNDCLILGNGSGDYALSGKIIVIPHFSNIVNVSQSSSTPLTLESVGALVIDCSEYGLGGKFNLVWGDDHDKRYNLAYLLTANIDGSTSSNGGDLETVRKIVLHLTGDAAGEYGEVVENDTPFNGTFDIVETYHQSTAGYPDCDQGTCYHNGELFAAIGHDGLRYWRMRLSNGIIFRRDYKQNTYYAGKTTNFGNASGICCHDGLLFIGRAAIGIMALRI